MFTKRKITLPPVFQLWMIPFFVFCLSSLNYEAVESPVDLHKTVVLDSVDIAIPPILDKGDLYVFMGAIAERESNNTPDVVNRYGYMGKYQFGPRTLWSLGTQFEVTKEEFLGNVALQDSAMVQYLRDNRTMIQDIIVRYNGVWYNGIYITESGLLAGAHLVGSHGLRAWFDESFLLGNRPRIIDGNGTHVGEYIRRFSGYSLDGLEND